MNKLMMVAFAAVAGVALAQEPEAPKENPGRGPGRRPMMAERGSMPRGVGNMGMPGDASVMAVMNPKVAEKIGLSDEVQLQIKKIDLDSRKAVRKLQQKAKAAMEKQAKLMKEAKVDEAAVMAVIDELFDLRKEMAKAQTKRVIAVKSLLTPEQLEKAAEGMKAFREEQRGKRMKEGGKRGHGNGPKHGEAGNPPPPPPEE